MENNKKVYCRGSENSKGVIEALSERGGINDGHYEGCSKNAIYYIDPIKNTIEVTVINSPTYNIIISNYTEIQPLKPKRWRATLGQCYYTLDVYNGVCKAQQSYDYDDTIDIKRYENCNYYRTEEECLKVANACNEIIKSSATMCE